jgi:hypothetical protein
MTGAPGGASGANGGSGRVRTSDASGSAGSEGLDSRPLERQHRHGYAAHQAARTVIIASNSTVCAHVKH